MQVSGRNPALARGFKHCELSLSHVAFSHTRSCARARAPKHTAVPATTGGVPAKEPLSRSKATMPSRCVVWEGGRERGDWRESETEGGREGDGKEREEVGGER